MKKIMMTLSFILFAIVTILGQNKFTYPINANGGLRIGGNDNILLDSIIDSVDGLIPYTNMGTQKIWYIPPEYRIDLEDYVGVNVSEYLEYYNVKDYGAVGDGSTDDTEAFQDCADDAGNYGYIFIPNGYYKITETVNFENNYITVDGNGIGTTRILFAPGEDDDVCFNFEYTADNTNDRWFQSIKNISFVAYETAYTKTALRFVNVRHCKIENISIHGWGATDNDAVGIQTNGREHFSFENITVIADRPFVIGPNPDYGSADVWNFNNIYCENVTTNAEQYAFEFTGSASNVSWTGRQSWATKGGGVKMDGIPFSELIFENVRWEQSAAGWMFYLKAVTTGKDVILRNCWSSNAQNGVYIENIDRVTIENFQITGAVDTSLYVHSDVDGLQLIHSWFTNGPAYIKCKFSLNDQFQVLKKTIGHPGETTTDFAWTSVANSDQQNLDLGAIIPIKAKVRNVILLCTEDSDAQDMFMGAGITSAGDEFIAIGTTSIDQANEVRDITTDGAIEAIPILWATTRHIWISGNPGTSNWSAMTTGEWTVYISYETIWFE